MIPSSISRRWNLREVDVSKRMLRDEQREYLFPMIEEVTLEIKFSPEAQMQSTDEDLFDPAMLRMYAEARTTHDELLVEIRKSLNKFNEKMLKHSTDSEKHTVYLLTRETSIIRKKPAESEVRKPDFDVQSVTSTVRTKTAKRPGPVMSWVAGVR